MLSDLFKVAQLLSVKIINLQLNLPTKMTSKSENSINMEKYKKRLALREEYLKNISNPHKHALGEGGTVFDAGLQRFQAMRVSNFEHFKPTPKSARIGLSMVVAPIVLYAWWLKSERDQRELKIRTGQVSYADRKFKFI